MSTPKKPHIEYTPETEFQTTDDFGLVYNLKRDDSGKGRPIMVNDISVHLQVRGGPKGLNQEIAKLVHDHLGKRFPLKTTATDAEL